jgi:urease accessory protein
MKSLWKSRCTRQSGQGTRSHSFAHSPSSGKAMLHGHLNLVCAADSEGKTHLRRQSFRAPVHLSKPHLDEGVLVVNIVNPTAGLLAGDRIDFDVSIEHNARVLLTAPSASRAHQMRGGCAIVEQRFHVAPGAWLEVWPELFIPQRGARYRQRTMARVEMGGEMLLIEMIAPGRAASGELFAYDEIAWETTVHLGEELIARERYALTPASPTLAAVRAQFPEAYYASVLVISERIGSASPCLQLIHALHDDSAWVGCSPLRRGGAAIRVLAAGSIALRKKVGRIREEIHAALGMRVPALRRN